MIVRHQDAFKNARIYMLTNESPEEAKKFCTAYHLDKIHNIVVGTDYEYSFYRLFLPPTLPFLAIYDSKRQLRRIYRGETDIPVIVNSLQ